MSQQSRVPSPFYQVKVEFTKGIVDYGCHRDDINNALYRTTLDSPPSGYYYVNENKGIYIFTHADWQAGILIEYMDRGQTGKRVTKTRFVGAHANTDGSPVSK